MVKGFLFNRFERWGEGGTDLWELARYGCRDFADTNPNMMKVVYACALYVSEALMTMGATPQTANLCGFLCLPEVLTLLRLIDRSLGARELKRKFEM